jgi:hypothetical protein
MPRNGQKQKQKQKQSQKVVVNIHNAAHRKSSKKSKRSTEVVERVIQPIYQTVLPINPTYTPPPQSYPSITNEPNNIFSMHRRNITDIIPSFQSMQMHNQSAQVSNIMNEISRDVSMASAHISPEHASEITNAVSRASSIHSETIPRNMVNAAVGSAHGNQAVSAGVGTNHQSASVGISAHPHMSSIGVGTNHPHMSSIAIGTNNPIMNSIGTNTNIQSTSIGVGTSHQSASIGVGPDAELEARLQQQQQIVVHQNPIFNQNVIIEEVPPEPQIIPPAILAPPVLHIGPPEGQQMVLYDGRGRGRGRPPLSQRGELTARERAAARREILFIEGAIRDTPPKKKKKDRE